MYVGLVNDELQGYERKWMNCDLWYLVIETEERHNDSLLYAYWDMKENCY